MERKRRAKGEHSIYQRKDGLWACEISLGIIDGKRKKRTLYGSSEPEVRRKLADELVRGKGKIRSVETTTIEELLERWLQTIKARKSSTTHDVYERMARVHITPSIGRIRLDKAENPALVESFYQMLGEKGTTPSVQDKIHRTLRPAFNYAIKMGLMQQNPCPLVGAPRYTRKEIVILDRDQAKALLAAAAESRLEAIYYLAIFGGMREGEIFALHWADVNFETWDVYVRYNLRELKGSHTLVEPKSHSKRLLPMPVDVMAALERRMEHAKAEKLEHCPLVFPNTKGGFLRRPAFRLRDYLPTLERAKLAPIRFHNLRHTANAIMLADGASPKIAQERLGHKRLSTTTDTYGHVLPGLQRDAIERVSKRFSP